MTVAQYQGLNDLYAKYHSQGLEILGFPCNQFLGQEPGDDEEIQSCAKNTHNAKFPIFKKSNVNGSAVNAVFDWVKTALPGFLGTTSVKWNFTKFLIDRNGVGFKRYSPHVAPLSLSNDVETLLTATSSTAPQVQVDDAKVELNGQGEGGLDANVVADLKLACEQLEL